MKKILLTLILIAVLLPMPDLEAAGLHWRGQLTGGTSSALDGIPIAGLSTGDAAMVAISGGWYFYVFDATGTEATDEVDYTIIRPADFVSAGVWRKVNPAGMVLTEDLAEPTSTAFIARDPSGSGSYVVIYPDGVTTQIQDNAGTLELVAIGGSGTSLPEGATEGDIIIQGVSDAAWAAADTAKVSYSATDYTPTSATIAGHFAGLEAKLQELLTAFNAAGLNSFTFTPNTPASYPAYFDSGTLSLVFDVTGSNNSFNVASVDGRLGGTGDYTIAGTQGGEGFEDQWTFAWTGGSALSEGGYSFNMLAEDDKTPTANQDVSSAFAFHVDLTDPVVADNATDATYADGVAFDIDVNVTELHIDTVTYACTDAGTYAESGSLSVSGTAPTLNATASVDPTGASGDITCLVTATDLAGNSGVSGNLVVGAAGDPPTSYLIEEYFNDEAAPTGWTITGTPTWGAGYVELDTSAAVMVVSPLFAAQSEVWVRLEFEISANPSVSHMPFLALMAGTTVNARVRKNTSGATALFHGTTMDTSAPAIGNATKQYLYLHYIKATGAGNDGILHTYISTTTTKGTATTISSGNGLGDIDTIRLHDNATCDNVLKVYSLLVSTTEIDP
jgi:hypothetical protein